jgi:hypothetical protein
MEVQPFVPRDMKAGEVMLENKAIAMRSQLKHRPVGGKVSDYRPENDNKIIVEWSWSDGIDFASSCLQFDLRAVTTAGGGTTATNCGINSAKDCFNQIELWHDNTSVIYTNNRQNAINNNILYAMEGHKDHSETEYQFMGGFNNQWLNTTTTGDAGMNRKYTLPLAFLHPFFSSHKPYPILGSRMRLVLYLASPDQVLSVRPGSESYQINDVRLITEDITYTPEYSAYIKSHIASGDGYVCQYVDFHEQEINKLGGSKEIFTIRNQFSNALTLYVYEKPQVAEYDPSNNNTYPSWRLPLAHKTTRLDVRSGNRNFTYGSEGSTSVQDHYILWEKCTSNFSNIMGEGLVNFETYTDVSGFSPLAISLERFTMNDSDYSVINRGLSANDAGANIDINIEMEVSTPIPSSSQLFAVLIHEKRLLWNAGGVQTIE